MQLVIEPIIINQSSYASSSGGHVRRHRLKRGGVSAQKTRCERQDGVKALALSPRSTLYTRRARDGGVYEELGRAR